MTKQEFIQGQAFKCAGTIYRFESDPIPGERLGFISKFDASKPGWYRVADVLMYNEHFFKVFTVFIGNVIKRCILFDILPLASAKDLAAKTEQR